jgi:hypothetical protein
MIVLSVDWHIIGLMRFKSPEGENDIELSFKAGDGQTPLEIAKRLKSPVYDIMPQSTTKVKSYKV